MTAAIASRERLPAALDELLLPFRDRGLAHPQSACRLDLGHLLFEDREHDHELLVGCLEGVAAHRSSTSSDLGWDHSTECPTYLDAPQTDETILTATGICSNKSSLATILANTSYRGLRVFNRESRIEGEHGRKRRKNNAEDMVTSDVDAIVPDALFDRVQVRLRKSRDNRLQPQRYAGGYVLTDVLRCRCGGKMAGNIAGSSRIRYYRCTAKCGRSSVPANELEQSVMDLVRRDLLSEEAVRSIIDSINEAIASRDVSRGPALAAGKAETRRLEREEANLHAALRQASAATMPSVLSALEDIATELYAAHARLDAVSVREKPVTVSDESVATTLAQLRGIAENGSLVERVAWIRSAFDHVEVFDDHAEAHWRETEEPVTSSIDVSCWIRWFVPNRNHDGTRALPRMTWPLLICTDPLSRVQPSDPGRQAPPVQPKEPRNDRSRIHQLRNPGRGLVHSPVTRRCCRVISERSRSSPGFWSDEVRPLVEPRN